MKTIRPNTFETNSSSTHSVTLINRSEPREKKEPRPLVEGRALFIDRLNDYTVHAGEASATTGDTREKKIAFVAHWLWEGVPYKADSILDNVFDALSERVGYFVKKGDSNYNQFSSSSEYDGIKYDFESIVEDIQNGEFETLDEVIAKIIDNDNIWIEDADAPY